MFLIIFTSIIVLFFIYKIFIENTEGVPPGERGIPRHYMYDEIEFQKCLRLQKRNHGNIFSFRFGSYTAIFMGDYENIELAVKRLKLINICEKKTQNIVHDYSKYGIRYSRKPIFERTRNFNVKPIEDFNLHHPFVDEMNEQKINQFLNDFEELKKETISSASFKTYLNALFCRILLLLTTGRCVNKDSMEHYHLADTILKTSRIINQNNSIFHKRSWILKHGPQFLKNKCLQLKELDDNWKEFERKFLEYVQLRKETEKASVPSHFVNLYLLGLERTNVSEDSKLFKEYVSRLVACLYNFFLKELDRISFQSFNLFSLMMQYPEVQTKIQKELDEVCGFRNLSMRDIDRLNYLRASLLEFDRLFSASPNVMMGTVSEEIMFNGYSFPKDSIIYGCCYLCHHDESVFQNPSQFRPERFLDDCGNLNYNVKGYVPFVLGKKPFVSLSECLQFFVVGSTLQRYTISSTPTPGMENENSLSFTTRKS